MGFGIRASLGIGVVCLMMLLIGTMLSIMGRDQAWMLERLEAARDGTSGEALLEATVVGGETPGVRAPFSGTQGVAYRAWIEAPQAPGEPPFQTADQQLFAPFALDVSGQRYGVDLSARAPQAVWYAQRVVPVEGEGVVLVGPRTLDEARDAGRHVEVVLRDGQTVSALGEVTPDPAGQARLGGPLVLYGGDVEAWIAQERERLSGHEVGQLTGLVIMALGGLGLLTLAVVLLVTFWRARGQAAGSASL